MRLFRSVCPINTFCFCLAIWSRMALFTSLSLQHLYSAARLVRKTPSLLNLLSHKLPNVDFHFLLLTKSFTNSGMSFALKWTNLLAQSWIRSIVFALMICWVLSSASLYGRKGISKTCTCFELEDGGEIMWGGTGVPTSTTSAHRKWSSFVSFWLAWKGICSCSLCSA